LAAVIYGLASETGAARWRTAVELLLLGCACLVSGGLLGFLFGIPRAPQSGATRNDVAGAAATGGVAAHERSETLSTTLAL